MKAKDIDNSKEASIFIKENLDYIINGTNTTHFENLYYVDLEKDKRLYYLKFDEYNYINLSTGEYFLLSVLNIFK